MARKNPFNEIKESTIVKGILKYLKKHYPGVWYKIHGGPYQQRGIPDIVGVYNGRFVGIEVKRPNKKDNTSAAQDEQLEQILNAGGIAGVATSIIEVEELMEQYLREKL